ncbi:hypothetical protein SI65_05939 [Aspergillus cristatus]|uniref:Uncharacterized protein n=1 Tax=Aspergillus cristatus TaxID=573508 RepID=A0A1E3BEV7_ASPCR|nr:hypothetical protein SI65_05939 [Aspergillus cristatus]
MAHHGIGRNPRLTRLMKKRSRVAAHSTPVIAHHPIPTGSGSEDGHVSDRASHDDTRHGTGHEAVPIFEKHQDIASSEDLAKVWATVVNVIDDDSYTSTQSADVTLASSHAWFDGSATAFPGYTSLTVDTPSLTSSSQSMASAASSAYSSAMTSRPLINSSLPTPSSTSLTPTASASGSGLSGSLSSATTSASLVTRSSTKTTSLPTSSSSSSFSSSFSSSTTSSTTTTSDSSSYSGWVGGGYGGGGGSQTGSGQNPISTDTDPNQNSSGAPGPATTGKIVGGVVGSVAGAVMLVILALFFLKRRASMRKSQQALPSTEGAGAGAGGNAAGGVGSAGMTSRPDSLLTATYFAPAFMKRWRQSTMTTNTDSTLVSSGSERGFQKISGRKIPSVLTHGGDGFGGGYDTGSPTLSEPSMTTAVPGSPVNPRSPLTQPPPSTPFGMPLDVSYTREAEENDSAIYMRASPARTPVTSTASMSSVSAPINIPRQSHSSLSPIPQRPDTLGRSHPSFDGSRGSRFTESL